MLATIEKIDDVQSVENADALDRVKVLGWQVVVKRGEFKVGDPCVYVRIDTILPDKPEFAFLADRNFRVRTIKLRGCLSQGICFPISILGIAGKYDMPGEDVSEIIGVVKYEKHVPGALGGETIGNWPCFIPKTDEERCCDENTLIETEEGQKTIKEICENKYRGKIKTFNINQNKIDWENIYNHSVLENNYDWYEIELENGEKIKLTGNHRIWIPSLMCWRMVQDLIGNEDVFHQKLISVCGKNNMNDDNILNIIKKS